MEVVYSKPARPKAVHRPESPPAAVASSSQLGSSSSGHHRQPYPKKQALFDTANFTSDGSQLRFTQDFTQVRNDARVELPMAEKQAKIGMPYDVQADHFGPKQRQKIRAGHYRVLVAEGGRLHKQEMDDVKRRALQRREQAAAMREEIMREKAAEARQGTVIASIGMSSLD